MMRIAFLAGVALNTVLVIAAVALFPQVIGDARTFVVGTDLLVLLGYAGWVLLGPGPRTRSLMFGAAAGLIQFADVVREYFTTWPSVLLVLAMAVSLGLFGAAGAGMALGAGAAQGVHAAIAAMLVLWVLAWLLDAVTPGSIGAALSSDPEYRASGLRDMNAYVAWNTMSAALSHLVLLPIFGGFAAAVGSLLRPQPIE